MVLLVRSSGVDGVGEILECEMLGVVGGWSDEGVDRLEGVEGATGGVPGRVESFRCNMGKGFMVLSPLAAVDRSGEEADIFLARFPIRLPMSRLR